MPVAFFHPDLPMHASGTLSVSEFHRFLRKRLPVSARGLYRRSGFSPCPEDLIYLYAKSGVLSTGLEGFSLTDVELFFIASRRAGEMEEEDDDL